MFKGLQNIGSLMKTAQEMQGRMADLQERLKKLRLEAQAGGGMVTVAVNGQQQMLSCRIEPTLLEGGDRELLEDLIVAATNQALEKARGAAADEMAKISGGLNVPGLGEALSKLGLGGST